jgi:putative lipoprotein
MKLLLAPLTVLAALVMVALALPGAVNADDAPTNNPLAGTGWYLLENKGAPMIEGTSITLSFDKNGQVGGSGGCNSYGGSYTVDGNSLRFSDVFSTLMACVDNMLNQQEADYFAALSQVTGYRRIGPERLVLDLSDGSALVFVAIPALPGSAWVLIDDGLPSRERLITADSGVTLTFDKDGGADIDTGCNGSYYTTYRLEVGALTFFPIISARARCENEQTAAIEDHLFAALEATTHYTILSDQLTLYFGEDEQALVFRRILNLEGTTWQLVAFGAEDDPTLMTDKVITVAFTERNRASAAGPCQRSVGDSYLLEALDPTKIHELPGVLLPCLGEPGAAALLTASRYGINDDNGQLVMHYGDDQVLVFEWIFQPSED